MEKILVTDIITRGVSKTLLSHAILQCCTPEVLANMKGSAGKTLEKDTRYIEVYFEMGGVPVKLSEFLNHLESELDRMIKEEARDIVLTQLNDITATLDELEQETENVIKRIVKERLNVTISDEW